MENMATAQQQASAEFIHFLEKLQNKKLDLPKAISEHWQEAVSACNKAEFNKAKTFCHHMAETLTGLRRSNLDLRVIDKAQSQISVLLGAVHLDQHIDQQDLESAVYFFEQSARRFHYWDYKKLESLSYFGVVLTRKQQKRWTEALGAAQKALNALDYLLIPDRTDDATRALRKRIEEEI
jgi:hypothetical protein